MTFLGLPEFDQEASRDAFTVSLALTLFMPHVCMIVLLLIIPSRRGYMRTRRELSLTDIALEEAITLYTDRLSYEGFEVVRDGNRLICVRDPENPGNIDAVSGKAVFIDMMFDETAGGVSLTAEARLNDIILFDTGEGRYVDETLDRALGADLEEEAPKVSMPSYNALCSFATAFGLIVAMGYIAVSDRNYNDTVGIALGMCVAAVAVLIYAAIAIRNVRQSPKEVSGSGFAIAAVVTAVIVMAATAVIIYLRFAETV